MEEIYREVRFDLYCKKCKYEQCNNYESPCEECLDTPKNLYSEKPINFEEQEM